MKKSFRERMSENKPISYFIAAVGVILIYMLLNRFEVIKKGVAVVLPVLLGAFLAFLLYGPQLFFEEKVYRKIKKEKTRRVLSVVTVFVLTVVFIFGLIAVVLPQFFQSVIGFIDRIDYYADALKRAVDRIFANVPIITEAKWYRDFMNEDIDWKNLFQSTMKWASEHRDGIVGVSKSVGNGVVKALLSLIFCLYIMLDMQHLTHAFTRFNRAMMSPERYAAFAKITAHSSRVFRRYFLANVTDALIIGVLTFIFLTITGIPYGMLVTLVVAVTNLVPTFGPVVGGAVSALLILLVKPEMVIWFLVYTVISQLMDSFLIKPILFGNRTGLRPMWVLAATVIGGGLLGVWGMLLGIPVAAIASSILEDSICRRLAERGYDAEGNPAEGQPSVKPETPATEPKGRKILLRPVRRKKDKTE